MFSLMPGRQGLWRSQVQISRSARTLNLSLQRATVRLRRRLLLFGSIHLGPAAIGLETIKRLARAFQVDVGDFTVELDPCALLPRLQRLSRKSQDQWIVRTHCRRPIAPGSGYQNRS